MSFTPSKTLPPVTKGADPSVYHLIGSKHRRGSEGFVMSRSELLKYNACPSRWIAGYREETNDSMEWGHLVDCLALTPERFETSYSITPQTYPAPGKKKDDPVEQKPWNWNASFCKEWRAREEAKGRTVVKSDLASDGWKAISRLKQETDLWAFIQASERQVQLCADWTDRETGIVVPFKALVDIAPNDGDALCDLKTTRNAHPAGYEKQVFNDGLHVQAAFYLDMWAACTGKARREFRHIIQENFEPYEVSAAQLSEEYITAGRGTYQTILANYCHDLAAGHWPGYRNLPGNRAVINGWVMLEPAPWMITAPI